MLARRVPGESRFRIEVLVDLSLAAVASVLRHQPSGDVTGRVDPITYLDAALDLLEHGAGGGLPRA